MENTEPKKNMMLVWVVVAVIVIGAVVFFATQRGSQPAPTPTETETTQETEVDTSEPVETEDAEDAAMEEGTAQTFNLTAQNFSFSQKEIRVKRGDTVKVVLTNNGGSHDWVIDEFNARTKVTNNGETDEVEFVADKTGTFEFYCSVGNHRQMGMVGNLVVE